MGKSINEHNFVEIDLGNVADRLSNEFPTIRNMYLFGSRVFGTESLRSDIDILLDSDSRIRLADLREFAIDELAALDLFVVEGGRATSAQNESYIEADDLSTLIQMLRAKIFWNRNSGRLGESIPWTQRVRADVEHVPTALPMSPERDRKNLGVTSQRTFDQETEFDYSTKGYEHVQKKPIRQMFNGVAVALTSKLVVAVVFMLVGLVVGPLLFGRDYKQRIANLEAQMDQPIIVNNVYAGANNSVDWAGDITMIRTLTQTEYDALDAKSNSTLYVILDERTSKGIPHSQ